MTHLAEETQMLWLKELQRITRDGALLALSVAGDKLRAATMPPTLAREFADYGFAAYVPNYSDSLSQFSHEGYYQEAYHSLPYIQSNWGRYFDVIEYVETDHQDIVILRAT
jgi:hypothetical protein